MDDNNEKIKYRYNFAGAVVVESVPFLNKFYVNWSVIHYRNNKGEIIRDTFLA